MRFASYVGIAPFTAPSNDRTTAVAAIDATVAIEIRAEIVVYDFDSRTARVTFAVHPPASPAAGAGWATLRSVNLQIRPGGAPLQRCRRHIPHSDIARQPRQPSRQDGFCRRQSCKRAKPRSRARQRPRLRGRGRPRQRRPTCAPPAECSRGRRPSSNRGVTAGLAQIHVI